MCTVLVQQSTTIQTCLQKPVVTLVKMFDSPQIFRYSLQFVVSRFNLETRGLRCQTGVIYVNKSIWLTENMDQKDPQGNRDDGSYQLSHVGEKLLLTDDHHQKPDLMKTSDMKPKRQ